jgi:hypothetical protein
MKDAYLSYKVSLVQKSSLWLPPTSTGEFVHKTNAQSLHDFNFLVAKGSKLSPSHVKRVFSL